MKIFLKILFPLLTVLCMVYIFSNSLENATVSAKKSSNVTTVVVQTIEKVTKKPVNQTQADSIIRKLAHYTEFLFFALFLSLSLYVLYGSIRQYAFSVLFCGLFTAVTDEFLQSFSKGRSSEIQDALIDFAGVLTGFGVAFLIAWIAEHKHSRKKDTP